VVLADNRLLSLGNASNAMQTPLPLLLALIAFSCGCSDGSQKGKFAVSGSESHALANQPGSLVILRGQPLNADHQPAGADRPLMYMLVVCPGLQANGSESEAGAGSFRSTHKLTWFATPNDVTIEIIWDRSKDTVELHGQKYNRPDGNIFVVVRELDGTISSWQVDSVEPDADVNQVMRHIREELSSNKLITDARLVELNIE
jgi:hypothetical protein